jgi:glutaredoxin
MLVFIKNTLYICTVKLIIEITLTVKSKTMETNQNQNQNQGTSVEDLKAMFADIQQRQTQKKRKTSAEILAKYFVPRNFKETFRILPTKQGRKPVEEAFFHVVNTVGTGGAVKKGSVIYCPAHNDAKVPKLDLSGNPVLDQNGKVVLVPVVCPLCEKYKELLSTQNPSIKGIKKEAMNSQQLKIKESNDLIYKDAIKWEAKKFYIIKGIDKGAEKDGVKFWRFKHNFKNQGTIDKLMPILVDYMNQYKLSYADPIQGCDLSITMADTEFMGRTYKQITAITTRNKVPLHSDPLVSEEWLADNTTWRDVFLPKRAPNTNTFQYLEMIVKGENPYWDDSNPSNKHWVFPNNPELEKLANTRTVNLDEDDENYEQASDLDEYSYSAPAAVNINNVQPSNVGTYTDNAMNVGANINASPSVAPPVAPSVAPPEPTVPNTQASEYDDLPF